MAVRMSATAAVAFSWAVRRHSSGKRPKPSHRYGRCRRIAGTLWRPRSGGLATPAIPSSSAQRVARPWGVGVSRPTAIRGPQRRGPRSGRRSARSIAMVAPMLVPTTTDGAVHSASRSALRPQYGFGSSGRGRHRTGGIRAGRKRRPVQPGRGCRSRLPRWRPSRRPGG